MTQHDDGCLNPRDDAHGAEANTGTTADSGDSVITTEVVTDSTPQQLNAEGGHGAVPMAGVPTEQAPRAAAARDWPLWEVFVRAKRGLSHVHVGSLHAPDAEMAVRNARDLYTRRQEGVSIWVMPAEHITASSPDEKDAFFDPAADKIYRHPTFYSVPEGVEHL